MMRRSKMRARVLVLRIVAAADVPAAQAQAQMHPVVASAQALLAAVAAWRYGTNLVEMRATVHWRFSVVVRQLSFRAEARDLLLSTMQQQTPQTTSDVWND
jgi:hypothetical protein